MPWKQFTVDEAISKMAADSISEVDIISEFYGWPSFDIGNSGVEGNVYDVHATLDPHLCWR